MTPTNAALTMNLWPLVQLIAGLVEFCQTNAALTRDLVLFLKQSKLSSLHNTILEAKLEKFLEKVDFFAETNRFGIHSCRLPRYLCLHKPE